MDDGIYEVHSNRQQEVTVCVTEATKINLNVFTTQVTSPDLCVSGELFEHLNNFLGWLDKKADSEIDLTN